MHVEILLCAYGKEAIGITWPRTPFVSLQWTAPAANRCNPRWAGCRSYHLVSAREIPSESRAWQARGIQISGVLHLLRGTFRTKEWLLVWPPGFQHQSPWKFCSAFASEIIFPNVVRQVDIIHHHKYTTYRCIVQCSSLHGYGLDISPWIVLRILVSGSHWYRLLMSQEAKTQSSSQASKSEALPEPKTKAPGVCFSSDGWGLRIWFCF